MKCLLRNILNGEEFTFCTRQGHAIDGLDQIWYTNSSLLEEMDKLYSSEDVRAQILSQGLPHKVNPSDHIQLAQRSRGIKI